MILPLQAQRVDAELIGSSGRGQRLRWAGHAGFATGRHRLAPAIAIRIGTADGPVVFPTHGLQMDHAAAGTLVLKV